MLLLTPKTPFNLLLFTHPIISLFYLPPDSSILSLSSGKYGLWSFVISNDFPFPLHMNKRLSPTWPTYSTEFRISNTTAVLPL